MARSFDLHAVRELVKDDLAGLAMYLQQLIGEPFVFFRESYAGELTIHFGRPIERKSPKLKDRLHGSYVVAVRGSVLMMVTREKGTLIFSDLPRDWASAELNNGSAVDMETAPLVKAGSQLVWAIPYSDDLSGGIGLAFGLSDETKFIVRPALPHLEDANSDDEVLPEIADWELYTPLGRYLRVGPGNKWAYLPSTKE